MKDHETIKSEVMVAENSVVTSQIIFFSILKSETVILNGNNLFLLYFDHLNAALVNIPDFWTAVCILQTKQKQ